MDLSHKHRMNMEEMDFSDKVLVVEDDLDERAEITRAMGRQNIEYMTAIDGQRAILLYEIHKPRVIILDLMLPFKNGYQVMQEIKPVKDLEHPPYIIMITKNNGLRHRLWAEYLGVSEYFQKPLDQYKLAKTAKSYMEKNQFIF